MADTKSTDAEKPQAAAAPAAAEQAQTQAQQPVQVQVDDENAMATYANFCRVTGSPEELIVDFGLEPSADWRSQGSDPGQATHHRQLLHRQTTVGSICRCRSPATSPSSVFWKRTSTSEFVQVSTQASSEPAKNS